MTLRSPVVAMLWENWRLTRVEAAWKLAVGIVAGMAALVAFVAIAGINLGDFAFDGESPTVKAARDAGAVLALIVIVLPNVVGWWSIGSLNRVRPRRITDAFAALTGYEQFALVVVTAVGVVVWATAIAVLGALSTQYSRRANIAAILLVLYGLAFVWLAVGVRADPETASQFHLDVVYGAMRWSAIAAMVFTTAYVFWSGFAERVLTIRYAGGAVAISAAFGAAWLTVLHIAGVQLAGMSAMTAISVVSPALVPLMASVVAPWSLNRIRHV
jgi:hypothetical protein